MNKISGNDRIALQRKGGVVERTHWVAGVVPHPESGGDTRIKSKTAEASEEPTQVPEKNESKKDSKRNKNLIFTKIILV
ncbi:hypothetical protein LPTSP3_g11570 [Leptospira kobayashii]|uniref:Uncharacterized protein n=1 Tax=Leptospira kobayashii TaxID=1917830 RepID=A0ABN6KBA6_9LEPT|nr:hypothetical protein [Leptospira kobayashii]BDA78227.1 hypothetical protein LPTSP3_g11570 [Leptospira kobayashii]